MTPQQQIEELVAKWLRTLQTAPVDIFPWKDIGTVGRGYWLEHARSLLQALAEDGVVLLAKDQDALPKGSHSQAHQKWGYARLVLPLTGKEG